MIPTATSNLEDLTLTVTDQIHVAAPLDVTFDALLEELGPRNAAMGSPMPMKIEPWPGGRWFRDLGEGNGHFWGNVQAIRRPALLEISGPLFMSYPVVSNVQYRLSEEPGGTLIEFKHAAFGLISDDHRKNVSTGWNNVHTRVRGRAEAARSKPAAAR